MATPFLLEPKIKFNPLLHTLPLPKVPLVKPLRISYSFIRTASKFNRGSKLSVRCLLANQNSHRGSIQLAPKETNFNLNVTTNPFEDLTETILNALKALRKPVIAGVLVGLLFLYDPNSALAASGGRTGGSSFSSRSSSSSRSFTTRTPSPNFSSSVPYYGPSPFGGGAGFYVGPAVSVGSSFFFVMMAFAAFFLVSGFLSDQSEQGVLSATEKTSVLKLQVGLLGLARTLQKDLNRIAETADTSSSEGLSYILTETTLALLRHPDYCISGYSSVDVKRSMDEGEKRFNQLSIEERGKFDEETLVNVNNIRKQSTSSKRANNGFSNQYIVVTILVAAEGVHKLPTINGSGDLKLALQKLGSIPSRKTLAVEVLWTPQNENDSLSERELLEDYSLLRPL